SFNPFAVSPKGAVGVMQLMRDTASQYGVVNRFNVEENLDAGIRHLKMLYQKYAGNISLTLAAYNAGEEAVSRYNGVPPYRETREYIVRVMKYMGMTPQYSSLTPARSTLFRYTTPEGRVVITDTLPRGVGGSIQMID
ncbi:MAG TPA: lytic transglycosylase domain-containing protein, partial [Candidatus Aminicenantes bacterium]|nr:lytic transglycosylase domain-containing protein [Candidatus Aminicenantes bacterium]